MLEENIHPSDWINAGERFRLSPKLEPAIDEEVSRVVGKKIYAHDPRLLKLIVKWKAGKSPDSMEMDNFFKDPKKIDEAKKVLSGNL